MTAAVFSFLVAFKIKTAKVSNYRHNRLYVTVCRVDHLGLNGMENGTKI